jgi:hypothetical protein
VDGDGEGPGVPHMRLTATESGGFSRSGVPIHGGETQQSPIQHGFVDAE